MVKPYDMFVSMTQNEAHYVASVEYQGSVVTQAEGTTEERALKNAIAQTQQLVRFYVGWEGWMMRLLKRVPVGVRKMNIGYYSYHVQF